MSQTWYGAEFKAERVKRVTKGAFRKVNTDLRELGAGWGKRRVHRLMRAEGLRLRSGHRRRPARRGGRPSVLAQNRLQKQFSVQARSEWKLSG